MSHKCFKYLLVIFLFWIYCGKSVLRIKRSPHATKLTADTFINVFDADDAQKYYLYPTKTNNNVYTLNDDINKLNTKYSTLSQSTVSIKTTDIQNENIFLLPYEICLGTVIGSNKDSASFIIQTAAHCIIDHPQFQGVLTAAHKPKVSSILIYLYTKIYHSLLIYLCLAWIIIITSFCLCYYWLSCKFVLLGFSFLVIIVNISIHFGQIELIRNTASKLLPISMDIKHSIYQNINTSLTENDVTISKICDILYFSLDNMLDYNHAMMDDQEWRKLVLQRGDFAFLECEYEHKMYKMISKYLKPSYPDMVDYEFLKALMGIKQIGILQFENINKYVMISGTFQRFIYNTPNGFIELHRKKICKQYIDECRIYGVNGDNTNNKMLEDLISWIEQHENEENIDYKYKQYSSVGKVSFVHSDHYFIGKFGAIQGWSGGVGVAGNNLNMIEINMKNNIFHCILVEGTLDIDKYRGNWCMLATHSVFAATYYKLINAKSNYFDISKLNRRYMQYAKKMKKNGHYLNKFERRDKSEIVSVFDDGKLEL